LCAAAALVRSTRRACAILAILVVLGAGPLVAQTSYCRTNADTAGSFVTRLQSYWGAVDTTYVKTQPEPWAYPADISLVTSSSTCGSGVNAYNRYRGLSGSAALTSAYVVALGTNGYVVIDPGETMGEFTALWVFDRRWRFSKVLAG
jgi:hypothetical protein